MRDLGSLQHNGPSEHKGPSDFNSTQDDDDDDDENGTPPLDSNGMLPPHFPGQPPFSHIRHHTPSASPPIANGVFTHPGPRGHTPQPSHMSSRPGSRNDMRRMAPGMVSAVGPPVSQPSNGYAYIPQPAIYGPSSQPTVPPHTMAPAAPYPSFSQSIQPYSEERRTSGSQPFSTPQGPPPGPQPQRSEPSPPQSAPPPIAPHSLPQINAPMPSPAPPPQTRPEDLPAVSVSEAHPSSLAQPQPPAHMDVKSEFPPVQKPSAPLLDTNVKRLPQGRKSQSIFTPIDDSRSILSQHLAAFQGTPKADVNGNRSQSIDVAMKSSRSPPSVRGVQPLRSRNDSVASLPDKPFNHPSLSNNLRIGAAARPRLTVQIPDDEDNGSATAESSSPRNSNTDATSHTTRGNSHSSGVVLPPPSPSASALLSAGATGPPNPFARPPPSHLQQANNENTPVSALPSRFLHGDFLPSPSSFYPDWNNSNTLPSPLNFATPIVGTGPSFLRDDASTSSGPVGNNNKRKTPEPRSALGSDGPEFTDAKRVKVE